MGIPEVCEPCLMSLSLQVGDEVDKDEPITTNPNVGGFGQDISFAAPG